MTDSFKIALYIIRSSWATFHQQIASTAESDDELYEAIRNVSDGFDKLERIIARGRRRTTDK